MTRKVKIGLLGCGTVGSGLVSLVESGRERIRARRGLDLDIERILIRDPCKTRKGVRQELLTTRAEDVVENGLDVLVEVIGGIEPANRLIRRAIERRRPVVTANKLLLAVHGAEIFEGARLSGVSVGFEASVCGGVPIVRALRSIASGDAVTRVRGVLNGTCNFILSSMEAGVSYDDALAAAQCEGFAEADPSLDVDGQDALQKLMILSGLAFGEMAAANVRVSGIRGYPLRAIRRARRKGKTTRLVAEARLEGDALDLVVEPRELDDADPLGSLTGAQNGVVLETEGRGELLLTGLGAGALPTASAVLSDVIEVMGRD
jgi:homoserine dehydrogenase